MFENRGGFGSALVTFHKPLFGGRHFVGVQGNRNQVNSPNITKKNPLTVRILSIDFRFAFFRNWYT
jgi:hypothetical protein